MKETSKRFDRITYGLVMIVGALLAGLFSHSQLTKVRMIRGEIPGATFADRPVTEVTVREPTRREERRYKEKRSEERKRRKSRLTRSSAPKTRYYLHWRQDDAYRLGKAEVSEAVYNDYYGRLYVQQEELKVKHRDEVELVTVRVATIGDAFYLVDAYKGSGGSMQLLFGGSVLVLVLGAGFLVWGLSSGGDSSGNVVRL